MVRKIKSPIKLDILNNIDDTIQHINANELTDISSHNYPGIIRFKGIDNAGEKLFDGALYEAGSSQSRVYDLTHITTFPSISQENKINVILVNSDGKPINGTVKFHLNPKGSLKNLEPKTVTIPTINGMATHTFETYSLGIRSDNIDQGFLVSRFEVVDEFTYKSGEVEYRNNRPAVLYSTDVSDSETRLYIIQIPDRKIRYTFEGITNEINYVTFYDIDIESNYKEQIGTYRVIDGNIDVDRNMAGLSAIAYGVQIKPVRFIVPENTSIINIDIETHTPISYSVISDLGIPTHGVVIHKILGEIDFVSTYTNVYSLYGSMSDTIKIKTDGHVDYYGIYTDITDLTSSISYTTITIKDYDLSTVDEPVYVSGALVKTNAGNFITNKDGKVYVPSDIITSVEVHKYGYDKLSPVLSDDHIYSITRIEEDKVVVDVIDSISRIGLKGQYKIRNIHTGSVHQEGFFDSKFTVSNVDNNTQYLCQIIVPGYSVSTGFISGTKRPNIIIELENKDTEKFGRIIFNVYDNQTSRPLEDVNVVLSDMENTYRSETTDDYGTILLDNITIGKTYDIKLNREDYGYYEGNISIPATTHSSVTLDTVSEKFKMTLVDSVSTDLGYPILNISLSLEPTYNMKVVEANIDNINRSTMIPMVYYGPTGQKLSNPFHIKSSGRVEIPNGMSFRLGDDTNVNTDNGGLLHNGMLIPGVINDYGEYYKYVEGEPIEESLTIKNYSLEKSSVYDGLYIHFGKQDNIKLYFTVNKHRMFDYTFNITSDYHSVTYLKGDNYVTISGYLNTPYTITVRGPGVYYTGTIVFTSNENTIDLKPSGLPTCGVTVLINDNFGNPVSGLELYVEVTNVITSGVSGATNSTTKKIATNEDGELVFTAPYGAIYSITSSDDLYPIHNHGVVPTKEQTVVRASTVGAITDMYTIIVQDTDGEPIVGAPVWLTMDEEGKYAISDTKITDTVGNVKFMLSSSLRVVYAWSSHPEVINLPIVCTL